MQVAKPVGRNAPALKYDILSALAVAALSGDKYLQRRVLRLMALITIRYNWSRNELSMGREEIARLWSVDERTVKREMAKMRAAGWIAVKKPGVRGRVAVYELDLKQLMLDTQPVWSAIGPDFEDRMGQGASPQDTAAADTSNVVPFSAPQVAPAPVGEDVWSHVQAALHGRDPELWQSWFRHLVELDRTGGIAVLSAPTQFMADYISQTLSTRIAAAYARFDPSVRSVRIEVTG